MNKPEICNVYLGVECLKLTPFTGIPTQLPHTADADKGGLSLSHSLAVLRVWHEGRGRPTSGRRFARWLSRPPIRTIACSFDPLFRRRRHSCPRKSCLSSERTETVAVGRWTVQTHPKLAFRPPAAFHMTSSQDCIEVGADQVLLR